MYNHIMHFKHVVEAGGFNKASDMFFISQPALTKAVQNIEKELEVKLLIRTTHGITLTDTGAMLYELARSIELQYLRVMQEIAQKKLKEIQKSHGAKKKKEKINFGCSALGYPYLDRFFNEFNVANPTPINVTYDSSQNLIEKLQNNTYDLVFCRILKDFITPDMSYIPLVQTHEVIFTSKNNPLIRKLLKQKQLQKDMPFRWIKLKYSKSPAYEDFTKEGKQYLSSYFSDTHASIEVSDITMAVQLLMQKEHCIILPIDFAEIFEKSGIVIMPFSKILFYPHWSGIIYKESRIKHSTWLPKIIPNLHYFFKSLIHTTGTQKLNIPNTVGQ